MEAGWISHGLAHLSSAAKAQGFDVDLIDLRALTGWEQYRAEIVKPPAGCDRRDHDERGLWSGDAVY